jgi:opacity protein-like surface antigen
MGEFLMRKILSLAAALVLAGASTGAMAAEGGQGFIGGEFGYNSVDIEVDGLSDGDDDRTMGVRAGYYFTPNIAIEGFYNDLYDYSDEEFSGDLAGWGLGLVARKNFGADGNGFYVAGRAGVFMADVKVSEEGFGSASDDATGPYFGAGLGYDFTDNFGLGLTYTIYNADFDGFEIDSRTLTAGIEFRF